MSALRIAILYPLSTAALGDEGNARVLAHRARLRGIGSTAVTVHDGPIPPADILLVGGLGDEGMPHLTERLRRGGLRGHVADGAVVLAVNAGYQVLGHEYATGDGAGHQGLGLLDVVSSHAATPLAGPVVTRPRPDLGLAAMSAYESHDATTILGPDAEPLVELELGHGNDGATDGALAGRIMGTYLHGPVLARNADLADLLLTWAVGSVLAPASTTIPDTLRAQRLAEDRQDPTGWGGRVYGKPRPRWRTGVALSRSGGNR